MKVVLNRRYGGFGISWQAVQRMAQVYHNACALQREPHQDGYDSYEYDISRDDPDLVRVVEELSVDSFGKHAKLAIVEAEKEYDILDFDGMESFR